MDQDSGNEHVPHESRVNSGAKRKNASLDTPNQTKRPCLLVVSVVQ